MLKIAVPVEVLTYETKHYEVEGEAVSVTIGATDARIVIKIEGPADEEFTFLTLHPKAFGALGVALLDRFRVPAPAAEQPQTQEIA